MFIGTILLTIIDQLIKSVVRKKMLVGQTVDFLGKICSFTYVQNSGAAFGSFSNGTKLLTFFTFCLLCAIVVYVVIYHDKTTKLERLAITLILSGGIGNFLDRLRLGYVVDFIDFHFWPVFNFADILVCVGCGLFVIAMLRPDKSFKKEDYKGFAIPEYDDDNTHMPGIGSDDIMNANKRMFGNDK